MTLALWRETVWTEDVDDSLLARLAWDLRETYRAERPPHLAVETLAEEIRDRFGLGFPVTIQDAIGVIQALGIVLEITRTTKNFHARWEWLGKPFHSQVVIHLSDRDAETRQTLSLFHELYEILREYFHAFNCARFPAGMRREDYVCEEMARRFSAAVCLPREEVVSFVEEHGLNVPLLVQVSGRSHGCVVRRLRDLLGGKKPRKTGKGRSPFAAPEPLHPDDLPVLGEETGFLCFRVTLDAELMHTLFPAFRCAELVRSHQFSLRRDRLGGRDYLIPRKREGWTLGPVLERVVESGRPVFAPHVTGFDLLGLRDLAAVAIPEHRNGHLWGVAIYATRTAHRHLWTRVAESLGCEVLPTVVGIAGVPVEVPKYERLVKVKHGDQRDTLEVPLRSGDVEEVFLYEPYRTELERAEDERRHNDPVYQGQVQLRYLEDDALLVYPAR